MFTQSVFVYSRKHPF